MVNFTSREIFMTICEYDSSLYAMERAFTVSYKTAVPNG